MAANPKKMPRIIIPMHRRFALMEKTKQKLAAIFPKWNHFVTSVVSKPNKETMQSSLVEFAEPSLPGDMDK